MHIYQVDRLDDKLLDQLSQLLIDVVHNGASVGFLAPLSAECAVAYWRQAFQSNVLLWVVQDEGRIVGSVQLVLCTKENGAHRAEIRKLMVHSANRGKGISTQLMDTAEAAALNAGRTLLVLDTQTGSIAEKVYQHLGWVKAGEIPDYAASPDGNLHGTTYFYKKIQ